MSGIVGVYYLDDQPVGRSGLERMTEALAHRGPDGKGTWYEGPVGFGQCMLWTTPQSVGEVLPLSDPSGSIVLTADARIDNRVELMAVLGLNDRPSEPVTDSKLILGAYLKWGKACAEHLIGDFTFVIWDGREHQLYCARDHIGTKPLYYHFSGKGFYFASEIKALLTWDFIPGRLNEVRIGYHLAQFFEDHEITYFQNIWRLPAAHYMTVDQHGINLQRYWDLDSRMEIRYKVETEYAEAFNEIFTEAVSCRLRSAYPVGSALSGGLDSSSIACVARNLLGRNGTQPLNTYSAIFEGLPKEQMQKIDERAFMQAVIDTGGFAPSFVQVADISPLVEVGQILWHQDEPYLAPNLYMHWSLYKNASQQKVRIFLDGIDGDVTVSHGVEYFAELTRTLHWVRLYREAKALGGQPEVRIKPSRIIWKYGLRPLIPYGIVERYRKLRGINPSQWLEKHAINPDFARSIDLEKRIKSGIKLYPGAFATAREKHLFAFYSGLTSYGLEVLDKTAAAWKIEARYPFFDRRLIEFCVALPASQKLANGWTRWVQREAMAGILPEPIRWRFQKSNLSPNFQLGLNNFERDELDRMVYSYPRSLSRYINYTSLQELYRNYKKQPAARDEEALNLFGILILSKWLSSNRLDV